MYAYDHTKEDEMGRACSTLGKEKNTYGILVGKQEGKESTRKA
jgi:hypothetical protein